MAVARLGCYNPAMADWRQIQARIRKAKTSQDPHAKLYELYQRTRDGMVAWEIAVLEEKNGRNDEAARWYTAAAQRFRRADWKKKAEDALSRLGVELPVGEIVESQPIEPLPSASSAEAETRQIHSDEAPQPLALGEIANEIEPTDSAPALEQQRQAATQAASADEYRKKRRRGRRGGRGRRRRGAAGAAPALPAESFAEPSSPPSPPPHRARAPVPRAETFELRPSAEPPRPTRVETAEPQLPSERTAHGRAGDPALASRMAKLESMLRRLVSSPLHRLDESDEAPAGPGVFLLSDSDQITSYYIEACQTLRVGLGNLVRGGRNARGPRGARSSSDASLKAKLAEYLGINEAKVGQYLKDHCVVRWIQLDEDAPHLAHFAIGVLRTPLNAE